MAWNRASTRTGPAAPRAPPAAGGSAFPWPRCARRSSRACGRGPPWSRIPYWDDTRGSGASPWRSGSCLLLPVLLARLAGLQGMFGIYMILAGISGAALVLGFLAFFLNSVLSVGSGASSESSCPRSSRPPTWCRRNRARRDATGVAAVKRQRRRDSSSDRLPRRRAAGRRVRQGCPASRHQ